METALRELVAALERYLAAKGRDDAEWVESFNALMTALQAAKRAME
jgi:hypothetical protein